MVSVIFQREADSGGSNLRVGEYTQKMYLADFSNKPQNRDFVARIWEHILRLPHIG